MSQVAEYFIYAVPVFGILLVLMSDAGGHKVYDFSQAWISTSFLLFIVGLGLAHGCCDPTSRRCTRSCASW